MKSEESLSQSPVRPVDEHVLSLREDTWQWKSAGGGGGNACSAVMIKSTNCHSSRTFRSVHCCCLFEISVRTKAHFWSKLGNKTAFVVFISDDDLA